MGVETLSVGVTESIAKSPTASAMLSSGSVNRYPSAASATPPAKLPVWSRDSIGVSSSAVRVDDRPQARRRRRAAPDEAVDDRMDTANDVGEQPTSESEHGGVLVRERGREPADHDA